MKGPGFPSRMLSGLYNDRARRKYRLSILGSRRDEPLDKLVTRHAGSITIAIGTRAAGGTAKQSQAGEPELQPRQRMPGLCDGARKEFDIFRLATGFPRVIKELLKGQIFINHGRRRVAGRGQIERQTLNIGLIQEAWGQHRHIGLLLQHHADENQNSAERA